MKDFVKQDLQVGDSVVHGVGGRSGGLSGPHKIHSFTAKMVRIRIGELRTSVVPSHNLVKVNT